MAADGVRGILSRIVSRSCLLVSGGSIRIGQHQPSWPVTMACVGAILLTVCGCGGGSGDQPAQTEVDPTTSSQMTDAEPPEVPPVAAIGQPAKETESGRSLDRVEPGSPDALLIQIAQMVASDDDSQTIPQASPDAVDDSTTSEPADRSDASRRRLERIIELATQVVSATHQQPELEQHLNNAVHYLSDARLELATAGDEVQAELLIEDAETLFSRDADSFAAAEAGFKVVELAHRMADAYGTEDADWLREYANQSLQYSQRFPAQDGRAAMSLFTAGRMCDRSGQADEALRCFQLLKQQYGKSVFAEQSSGFLRRLTLVGQPLELSGPTIDGGFLDVEQYSGRHLVVVFWTSTSSRFREDLTLLRQIETQFSERQLTFLGVNLDTDEATVDRFLTAYPISWPQVFSTDPNQRGGRNPVARYYSVQRVPVYWLVDRAGTVVASTADTAELHAAVQNLLNRPN